MIRTYLNTALKPFSKVHIGAHLNQSITLTYSVEFTITDGTNPIEGAIVTLIGYSPETTDVNGECTIVNVSTGTINYLVEADGYDTVIATVSIIDVDISEGVAMEETVDFTENLLAAYEFNEESGTTVEDSHSNNDAVNNGATINQTGKLDKSYAFNGTTNYIAVPTLDALMSTGKDLSFSFWFKTTSTAWQSILGVFNTGSKTALNIDMNYSTANNAGHLRFYQRSEDGGFVNQYTTTANPAMCDGNWHHAVVTWENRTKNVKIYFDGVLTPTTDASQDGGGTTANFGYDMYIGAVNNRGAIYNPYNGSLDELEIYSGQLLTQGEVDFLYNNGNGRSYPQLSESPETHIATFTVTDGTDPIEGATVTMSGYTPQTTDVNGQCLIPVHPGTINYSVTAPQHNTVNGSVVVIDSNISEGVTMEFVEDVLLANITSTNAPTIQTVPTYEGSGQLVHPDMCYVPAGWNGYKYWLAMTPYPSGNDDFENPSVVVSNDGNTWTVPAGLTNPVIPSPGGSSDYNADPNIFLGYDNKLWMIYIEVFPGTTTCNVKVVSSVDGVNWGTPTTILTTSSSVRGFLSPSIIKEDGQYVLYYADWASGEGIVKRRTATTPNGTWSAATTCSVTGLPTGRYVWHLDVVEYGDEYHMLINSSTGIFGAGARLNFGISTDGINWTAKDTPLLDTPASGWDSTLVYRGTLVLNTNANPVNYDMWYSGSQSGTWGMGRTIVNLFPG